MKYTIRQRVTRFFFAAPAFAAVAIFGGGDLLAQTTPGPQPSICSRACWSARSGSASEMSGLNRAVIHHTAGSGDYNVSSQSQSAAKVRAIQNLHMDSNGWSDIGYHFLVDKLGNTFEGRVRSLNTSQRPRGAHDGNNTNSFGFNVMGYYHPPHNQSFTTASRNALWNVIAWRMPSGWSPYGSSTYNGKTVGRVAGHRNVKSTACPGDGVYATIGTNFSGGTARNAIAARRSGGGGSPPPPPPPPANGACNTAMVADDAGRIWYAQVKQNGHIYTRRWNQPTESWYGVSQQESAGGWSQQAAPALVLHAGGSIRLIAIKDNGRMYHRRYSFSDGWGGWSELGNGGWSTQTGPVAVLEASGDVSLAAVTASGTLRTNRYSASTSSWGSFTTQGQADSWAPAARPALIADNAGRLHLLATKKSNGVIQSRVWENGSWTNYGDQYGWSTHGDGWSGVGGIAGTVRASPHRVTWVGIKSNGRMYQRTWSASGGWASFTEHGSGGWNPYTIPGIVEDTDNRNWVFGAKLDGTILYRSWKSGDGWSSWWSAGGSEWSFYVGPTVIAPPTPGGIMWTANRENSRLYTRRATPFFGSYWWDDEVDHGDSWVK